MSGAIVYIPVSSVERADELSRGVYRISRPAGHRPDSYRTTHAFGWVVHPETGAVMLALDPTQTVPCHVAADPAPLLEIIEPETTQDERDRLAQKLRDNAGGAVALAELVPVSFASEIRTREQLDADGWFPAPEIGQ